MNQTKDEGDFQAMFLLHHKAWDLLQDHGVNLYGLSKGNHRHHLQLYDYMAQKNLLYVDQSGYAEIKCVTFKRKATEILTVKRKATNYQ